MEHEHSILFAPVNALLVAIFGTPHEVPGVPSTDSYWLPDHVIMSMLVVAIVAIVMPLASRRFRKEAPGNFQQLLELVVGGLRGLLEDVIGHGGGQRFLYIIGTFAVFICLSNTFGLFFFLQPPTSEINVPATLAIISFLYYNFVGFRKHGIRYLKQFVGPIWWLAPMFLFIEPISHLARMLSLTLRLTGNIGGEHTATNVFMGIMPFVVPWPMMALGIMGIFLQTFIFIMLSSVYLAGAVSEEH